MHAPDAARSGRFRIRTDVEINRLGFGAMHLTGRGIWGEPADGAAAICNSKRLPELKINFIDAADAYGPDISEALIREAHHLYGEIPSRRRERRRRVYRAFTGGVRRA